MFTQRSLFVIRVVALVATLPVSAAVAWWTYPHDRPEVVSTDVDAVSFITESPIDFGMDASSFDLEMVPAQDGGTAFSAYGPPTPFHTSALVASDAWGSRSSCAPGSSSCSLFRDRKTVEFQPATGTSTAELESHFSVPATESGGYPTTESDGFASIQLPGISVTDAVWDYSGVNPGANVPVVIDIRLPGWKKYQWSGGPEPGEGASADDMSFTEITDSTGSIPSIVENGVSLAQQHADGTRTLVAGAFIGLMGAAVIALIQEIRRDGDGDSGGRVPRRERRPAK